MNTGKAAFVVTINISIIYELCSFANILKMDTWESRLTFAVFDDDLDAMKSILSEEGLENIDRNEWYAEKDEDSLHQVARFGKTEMIELLINNGFNVNSFVTDEDAARCTSLHEAVYFQHLDSVKLLLKLGADVKLHASSGTVNGTPLEWAKDIQRARLITDTCSISISEIIDILEKWEGK